MSDPLDVVFLRKRIEELAAAKLCFVSSVQYAEETGSTNDDAAILAMAGARHGALVIADHQTLGRGREGRAWHAAPRESLLFSLVLRLDCADLSSLTLALGLGLSDAVARYVDDGVGIKWPNDVLVRSKKLGGVLVEASFLGSRCEHVIVGVGINVLQRRFDAPVDGIATSLARECGGVRREDVLLDVLVCLHRRLAQFERGGLGEMMDELVARDVTRGRTVMVGEVEGVADGIDGSGRLRVVVNGATRLVCAGELAFRK